jgi:hypothetical protein
MQRSARSESGLCELADMPRFGVDDGGDTARWVTGRGG